ncbi:MAG: Gx transporter family protein [Spirochaetes bacterium]|nr:Gx transporter family protein [Spirochaetota bacterium]
MRSTPSLFKSRETLALLAACCIFLAMIEYIIPKPILFIRYGIANIPIMVSLKIFSPRMTMALVFLKIIGQGIITGTLFSYIFLFSLSGSLASGIAMIIIYRICKDKISMVGVSITGAFASNTVQLIIAKYLIFGKAAILMAPPVLIIGIVTSLFTGIFAELFISKSQWLKTKLSIQGQYAEKY